MGLIWIFASDTLLSWMSGRSAWPVWAMLKGSAFIVITGLFLLGLVYRLVRSLALANRSLAQSEERHRRLAETRRVLLAELDHRVKNNLAALASLLSLEARRAADAADLAQRVRGRIMAMKAVHELIASAGWEPVTLSALARALGELQAPGAGALRIEGEEVRLSPRRAGTLAIILQELLTNSHKHGALGSPRGRVELAWRAEPGPAEALRLTWTESGGPPVPSQPKRGGGLDIIDGLMRYDLAGEAQWSFEPAGIVCTLRFPLREAPSLEGGASADVQSPPASSSV